MKKILLIFLIAYYGPLFPALGHTDGGGSSGDIGADEICDCLCEPCFTTVEYCCLPPGKALYRAFKACFCWPCTAYDNRRARAEYERHGN